MIGDTALILAAGGSGTRYGKGNKLFAELGGLPLVIHSVRNLGVLFPPECRIMAVSAEAEKDFEDILTQYAPDLPFRLIRGGANRTESVQNALAAIPDNIRYVAIHDAARPLATPELLEAVLSEARKHGGAIPGHPVADTMKRVNADGFVSETVPRERVFAVETPQCFELARLREAIRCFPDSLTDDAGTMEMAGYPVKVVLSQACNLKLTRPEDLAFLEKNLAARDLPGKML